MNVTLDSRAISSQFRKSIAHSPKTIIQYRYEYLIPSAPRHYVAKRSTIMVMNATQKRKPSKQNSQAPQSMDNYSDNSTRRTGKISDVMLILAATGATTGTFLDGIHSRVSLLIYDKMPIDIGGLHTSYLVPPLLGVFYVVLGMLVLYSDYRSQGDKTTQAAMREINLSKMAVSFGVLAGMLELSSLLYTSDWSSNTICLVLALCAAVNYLLFDSTKQGLALALLCAIAAPASELFLMNTLDVWHYPQGDLATSISGGIPKWVPFCYFFYVPSVANLSRYLWKTM